MRSPAQDADGLKRVLADPIIGRFNDVVMLKNRSKHQIEETLFKTLADRQRQDLVLVYFTCHGIKDVNGKLYFAANNTRHDELPSTAVAATFVNEQMEQCRAEIKVILLDCCYSGAFATGFAAKSTTTEGVVVNEQLSGNGTVILASSGALEYAFEGDRLTKTERRPSVFTDAVIEGLETGNADLDRDGRVSANELYDYVYDVVQTRRAPQTPTFFSKVAGTVYLAWAPSIKMDNYPLVTEGGLRFQDDAVLPIFPATQVPATERARRRARTLQRLATFFGGHTTPSPDERWTAQHPLKSTLITTAISTIVFVVLSAVLSIWVSIGQVWQAVLYVFLFALGIGAYRLLLALGKGWRHRYIGLYKAGYLDSRDRSRKRLLIPIGHFVGVRPSTASEDMVCEIRRGAEFVQISRQEFLAWWLAHGTPTDKATFPLDRQSLVRALPPEDAGIDRLVSLGLLVEVERGTTDVSSFARTHRFVPLLPGLGNTTTTPWLYRIGMVDQPLVEVHSNIYRIFVASASCDSLWDTCAAVARSEAPFHLDMFVQGLPALLAVNAGHLDRCLVDTLAPQPTQSDHEV